MLLRLLEESDGSTVRSIGEPIGLDPAGVHRALKRLADARLVDTEGRRVNRAKAEEFLGAGVATTKPLPAKSDSAGAVLDRALKQEGAKNGPLRP